MKQIKYYIMAAMAVMTMSFVGCTEDNTMKDAEYNSAGQSSQRHTPDVDEVMKALSEIPEVFNVQKVDNYYSFCFEQPVDHYDLNKGYYPQYCQLTFKGWDNNVVVYTHGYAMGHRDVDLTTMLDANQLNIEHRYFGNSLPEPFENQNMTYLNADQQSRDIHRIVSALRTKLFKTGKWVGTGVSKDGITSALQAYYSDLNGWHDFDAYVPFCAPFLTGTKYVDGSFSCVDITPGTYLREVCGNGYPAGSFEAIAYQYLRLIPWLVCTNQNVRDMAIKACYATYPTYYAKVVEQYNNHSTLSTGDLTKDLTAHALYIYYSSLHAKFSYVPYTRWAGIVPDPTPLANGTATAADWSHFMNFYTMNDGTLTDYLKQLSQQTQGNMRSVTEEMWDFLLLRRDDTSAPYDIQAFMELGALGEDYSIVNGSGYLTETECEKVNYQFTIQARFEDAGAQGIYKQDRGKLMTDFRTWAETENTQPIIFVYAYNDPWTGGGISDATAKNNPMIEKVIDYIATHSDYITNRYVYTQETEQAVSQALARFLK